MTWLGKSRRRNEGCKCDGDEKLFHDAASVLSSDVFA